MPVQYANLKEEKDGNPWYHEIMQYLKNQQYPDQAT